MNILLKFAFVLALSASMPLQAGERLNKAATAGDLQTMRDRVNAGEKVNDDDVNGWTALMWAVYYERLPATDWLLKNGADPNLQTTQKFKSFQKGSTALIIAAIQAQGDLARLLLLQKAKVDLNDEKGLTALDHAQKKGARPVLQALGIKTTFDPQLDSLVAAIEAGKNINEVDSQGWTALMWAVHFQDLQTAKFLLEKGADPNKQSTGSLNSHPVGSTALTMAAYLGLDDMAGTLVYYKARVDLPDAKGNTAESYAHHYWYSAVVNGMADTSPLANSYQKVVFAEPTLDPGIGNDLAYLAEECQLMARESLGQNDAFLIVDKAAPGKP